MCVQLKKFIFILFLFAFAVTTTAAEKWGVIIGINDYKVINPDLRYCESDASKMKDFLTQKAGFNEKNIKTLFGKEATKKNIREAIKKWLATNVKQNERVVVYFSGHGVQFRDDNGDEEDGLDEMLCAYDSGRIDFTFIKDDELSRWLRSINTDDKIVIMDCCHSGTGTKAASINGEDMPTVKAYYPEPDMAIQRATKADIKSYLGSESEAETEIQARGAQLNEDVDGVASISGCRDDQVAMESPRLGGGVLSYYLTKTLDNLTDEDKIVTVYEAWKTAKNEIRTKNWQQEPQFGGSQNISIVGEVTPDNNVTEEETSVKENPFDATITSVSNDLFRISIGKNKDVTCRSIYSVYSKDAEELTPEPKAKIKITEVMENYSDATILEGQKVEKGDKVVEESHYIETEELLVRVESSQSEVAKEIKKAVGKIEHVILAKEGQTPDLIIQSKVKKEDKGKLRVIARLVKVNILSLTRPVSVLIQGKEQIHDAVFKKIFAGPKDEFGNPVKDENGQPIVGLATELKRCYVMKSLAKLENPNPGFKINLSIDKGSQAVYQKGDVVSISMKPTHNCYVYILDIGTSGAITLLFPNKWQSDNHLQAGQKFTIDSLDESGDYQIEVQLPPGEERIKAIATTKPIPLEELTPDNIKSPVKTFRDNASDMVEFAMKDLRLKPRNKWAVEDVFFRIGKYDVYQEGNKSPLELELLE